MRYEVFGIHMFFNVLLFSPVGYNAISKGLTSKINIILEKFLCPFYYFNGRKAAVCTIN